MQIVWFKRDLRIQDNEALTRALANGDVLPLYIIEPALWQEPVMSHRHYMFLLECLHELDAELTKLGQPLIVRVGEAVDVLEALCAEHNITDLWSHMETWTGWTYERDKAVARWAKSHDVTWHEPKQYGIIRALTDRNGWAAKWYKQMKQSEVPAPASFTPLNIKSDDIPSPESLGLEDDGCIYRQKGGRAEGLRMLDSFLYQRGEHYTRAMSSPVVAYDSCSRISAHLAFGVLSMREVFHAAQERSAELAMMDKAEKGRWPSALKSFAGRLRWHCHFMQKLEDEPRLEFENLHPAYNGLREPDFNDEYFEAWRTGMTGYPMVDACMRALNATGWLNFRMRAMLMSFASYHLWLHWRTTSKHLARMFTDYEPGIHYSQVQMQSGTTGINTLRIYNPIKQSQDHDPDGVFIKQWIPELTEMPSSFIHQPWLRPELLNGYPMPIVDEKIARKQASSKMFSVRKSGTHRSVANAIVNKHGSRKSGVPRTLGKRYAKPKHNPQQIELPL